MQVKNSSRYSPTVIFSTQFSYPSTDWIGKRQTGAPYCRQERRRFSPQKLRLTQILPRKRAKSLAAARGVRPLAWGSKSAVSPCSFSR